MESLTLGEQQQLQSDNRREMRRHERHVQSPRLPTPEELRSKKHAVDHIEGLNMTRKDSLTGDYNPHSSPVSSASAIHSTRLPHWDRRSSRDDYVPHSPPYGTMETNKPSLPPLKTVLRNTLSSPPQTPTFYGCGTQPSPREPSDTPWTYKPPSLYPNKKAKIDSTAHAFTPFPGASGLSTLAFQTATPSVSTGVPRLFATNSYPSSVLYRPASPSASVSNRHPLELPRLIPGLYNATSAHGAIGSGRTFQVDERNSLSTSFQQTHASIERHDSPMHTAGGCESRRDCSHETDRFSRRRSMDSYGAHFPRDHEPVRSRRPSCQADRRRQHVLGSDLSFDEDVVRCSSGHSNVPFPTPRWFYDRRAPEAPAFFMPAQYEHQNGKARKRSNLPKQSTEIMKTWFDQNIANPYPSEDQKAIFSHATGISMTQVSNWFINHRRRCPELKDKREKTRCSAREDET